MIIHPLGFKKRLVRIALGQVGVREVGVNGGPDVRAYQSMTWFEPGPWAWCAAFVCWCYSVAALGSRCFDFAPDTPRAFGFEQWAYEKADVIVTPSSVVVSDIVIFDYSHVGIVSKVYPDGSFDSVEGNTGPDGGRDGDGVYVRHRHLGIVRSVVRLHE